MVIRHVSLIIMPCIKDLKGRKSQTFIVQKKMSLWIQVSKLFVSGKASHYEKIYKPSSVHIDMGCGNYSFLAQLVIVSTRNFNEFSHLCCEITLAIPMTQLVADVKWNGNDHRYPVVVRVRYDACAEIPHWFIYVKRHIICEMVANCFMTQLHKCFSLHGK